MIMPEEKDNSWRVRQDFEKIRLEIRWNLWFVK